MLANGSTHGKRAVTKRDDDPPDLQTQLEALLDQVWRCEAEWRRWDRIDAVCAADPDCRDAVERASFERRTRRLP
jgi:hypothetical protein